MRTEDLNYSNNDTVHPSLEESVVVESKIMQYEEAIYPFAVLLILFSVAGGWARSRVHPGQVVNPSQG